MEANVIVKNTYYEMFQNLLNKTENY